MRMYTNYNHWNHFFALIHLQFIQIIQLVVFAKSFITKILASLTYFASCENKHGKSLLKFKNKLFNYPSGNIL